MTTNTTSPSAEQQHAIEQTEGPCMVLAGPGSGKTYVLTHRIAHLLNKPGIYPWNILALTFTNKAAREMTSRIQQLVGDPAQKLWIGTFHSLFARMLRIEADHIGLPRDFTIYDTEESKKIIKKIVKERSLSEDKYKPNTVLNRISFAKNCFLIDAKGYKENLACQAEDEEVGREHMAQVFDAYEKRLQRAGAVDFDDILLRTYYMLRDFPEIAAKYQERFHYILVDEFQDTNKLQYNLIKRLAKHHGNLCVIGDDAQSIYAFRGADVEHMLNFKKDFPQTKEIKLARNFRSTQHIVKAANSLIRHNQRQLEKVLFTDNALGEPISLVQHRNDLEEGLYISRNIFETSQREKATYDQFAVLYRTNRQSRIIEEALRKLGIQYKLRGGTSFYARKEIKEMLSYLRLLVNPNDEQALERIINTPKRGIGPATLAKVRAWALEQDTPLWEALEKSHEILSPRLANAIQAFVNLINSYKKKLAKENAYTLAKSLAEASGLTSLYYEKSIEELSRYENVQELLSGIDSFVQQQQDGDQSLSAYLQEIALMTGDEKDDDKPSVTLMTIHAAKGLEYEYVYLIGLEEGILPSPLMADSKKGLEEERRLFYVAITRAKKHITLSYALLRKQFENYKRVIASRFVHEIEPSLLQHTHNLQKKAKQYDDKKTRRTYASQSAPPPQPPLSSRSLVSLKKRRLPPNNPSNTENNTHQWQVGMQVMHPKFGQGTLMEVSHTAHGERVKINFPHVGTKTLLVAFAKLTIVKNKEN